MWVPRLPSPRTLSPASRRSSPGTPKSTGVYYDVACDRALDGLSAPTGTGLAAATCTPFAPPNGTTTDNDQGVDIDDTKLNGGAPGAALTEGGIASLDPTKLSRDPAKGCVPVYPWNFVRTNIIFGAVHAAGGYSAWIDKHPSYSMVGGPGGRGLNDYYSPEVDSNVVPLPGVTTPDAVSCAAVPGPSSLSGWDSSFANIQCYDALRLNALLNQIAGKTHNGASAETPAVYPRLRPSWKNNPPAERCRGRAVTAPVRSTEPLKTAAAVVRRRRSRVTTLGFPLAQKAARPVLVE